MAVTKTFTSNTQYCYIVVAIMKATGLLCSAGFVCYNSLNQQQTELKTVWISTELQAVYEE